MDPLIALLAAAVGYLLGSISFARIVTRLFAPSVDIGQGIEIDIAGTEEKLQVRAIAGTAVASQLGEKYGCLTAILDMAKVAIPTLTLKFVYPETSYFLVCAAMGLVGHNWPIYYRFRGGRGLSAIYGGFLVVDWIGTLVTAVVAMILGLSVLRSVLVAYTGGMWLMVPWLWFRSHDPAYVVYALFVNVIYWIAMMPEIKAMSELRRRGIKSDFESDMLSTPMGRGIYRMASKLGVREERP